MTWRYAVRFLVKNNSPRGQNKGIEKRGLCIDRESNRVPPGYETDALTIKLNRNWLWEIAAGFGYIVISVCYVMNADQQLLYGCIFSYGESLLQSVPET